jgi:CelD/BcsL family acetyltransferase involved in cellulose biosynthesis
MRVEVFTAASAFHDLRAEWRHVLSQLPFQSVFFTPQWQETWWRHFGATRQLHLLTVRSDDGTLQGLAPLMSSNGAEAPPRLELLGDLELCDYLVRLQKAGCPGVNICRHIKRHIQRYWISRRLCRSISCSAAEKKYDQPFVTRRRSQCASPSLVLEV